MNAAEAGAYIQTRLHLTPLAFRSDICLYRPNPQSGLTTWLAARNLADRPPYWAYSWAGGAALALYLVDHPEVVSGHTVLDLGAGSGLVGIAAAKAGAARVLAMESDPLGRIAIALNAAANGAIISLAEAPAVTQVDVVLAGDVFYDSGVRRIMLPLLEQALGAGAKVLVGDPFRTSLPLERLEELARFFVPDFGTGEVGVEAGVFALRA